MSSEGSAKTSPPQLRRGKSRPPGLDWGGAGQKNPCVDQHHPGAPACRLLRHPSSAEEGSTTIYFLLFTIVMLGFLVMAVDLGRIYLIQGELQTAADAAALAAATRLVGTAFGDQHADEQWNASFDSATGNDNRFNLRLNSILFSTNLLVQASTPSYFSNLAEAIGNGASGQTGGVDWGSGIYPKYARVQISAQAPVLFASFLNRSPGSLPTITVSAVAGLTGPLCTAPGIDAISIVDPSGGSDADNFGLVPGDYYTLSQASQTALDGTDSAPVVQYVILDHFPNFVQDTGLIDDLLFELAAGGISTAPPSDPPGRITIGNPEITYGNAAAVALQGTATSLNQDLLCGLNLRFGADALSAYDTCANNPDFAELATLFHGDTDIGSDALQDFAMDYDGNTRRVLTVAVVDSADTTNPVNVLNFRQFLLEPSPGAAQSVDPTAANGAFRAQYIGALVPLRAGTVGGSCGVTSGVGRVVLH